MNLLEHRTGRKALFALLYFSEGAPIGFVWWALPTMLREAGVPIERITALVALLTLVWALKFLWAPLVDLLRGPRWTLRGWIVASQLAMAASLLPLAWIDFAESMGLLASLLFLHAIAAATQDVSIDALAIRSTRDDERGSVNGWMQAGMLLGRSAFGGGARIARRHFGDGAVVFLLVAVLGLTLASTLFFRDGTESAKPVARTQRLRDLRARLGAAIRRKSTWLALAFAATGGAAYEGVGAVAGPFLVDRGLASDDVGLFFALPSVACMLVGALLGGFLADRFGRRRTVVLASVWIAGSVLLLAFVDGSPGMRQASALLPCLAGMYFGIGLFTASSHALFMDLTDPALGSTQFSAFMGATNLCEAWAALAIGRFITGSGYASAFAAMAILSLLALPLVAGMRTRGKDESPTIRVGS
jgi:MFS family permease